MNTAFYVLRRLTRPAYRIRGLGLGRVCEAARRWAARAAPPEPFLIEDFRGDARFRCYLREHMGGQIFFRGAYSGDQLALLERLLEPDGVFVDVGANQGEFSVAAARAAPRGRVLAFEPVREYRERLEENARLNGMDRIQVLAAALGDQDGELPIYDQPDSFQDGTRHEGLPTLFPSERRNRPREIVPVRRLDDLLPATGITRLDVMKLDVEGAEWSALRGAAGTLARFRPTLIMELGRETCQAAGYQPEALAAWVVAQGYRLERIGTGGRTTPVGPADLTDFQNVVAYPK